MRFKSKKVGGYQVFAVTGTNTVSFGIDFKDANTDGLLGFAVERSDPAEKQKFFTFGFKVFPSVIPAPDENTTVKTFDHPIQSFVTDDFTAKPDRIYEYTFSSAERFAENLNRNATPIPIKVRTEKLFSNLEHDIFFNRGVASSQAYNRKFQNKRPDDPTLSKAKQAEARQWLSRDLDEAMLKFIKNAGKGDTLLGCFYEFRYRPVADALRAAQKRGVKVRIIVDGKKNKPKDKNGKLLPPFPRTENLKMIKDAGLPKTSIILREARTSSIQHNKFMVLLTGKKQIPSEVWTGSTNLSDGGVHGQTNVGHWVRDKNAAKEFKTYWDLLSDDPGETASETKAFKAAVEAIQAAPTALNKIKAGITTVFSPRKTLDVLEMYADLVDNAKRLSCITLAFGIGKEFKRLLKDNTKLSHVAFFLLEKEDKPNKRAKDPFVALTAKNNVYKAWGSFLREPLYPVDKETNTRSLKLNTHVSYVHSKFLLRDPLGEDPIVVTGSANFSKPSTDSNDENMLIIRGNQRAADIYFTEFNRLFYHYYFRSVQEQTAKMLSEDDKKKSDKQSLFLLETDEWIKAYKPGSLKRKRVDIFRNMEGFE